MTADWSRPRKRHTVPEIHMTDEAVDNLMQPVETQMSRRRLGDEPRANYTWLVTFTDVMGPMLTFFVMMFAMAEPQNKEYDKMTASLRSELGRVYGERQYTGTTENIDLAKVNFNRALDVRYLEELIRSTIEAHDELKSVQVIPQADSVVLSLPQELLFDPGQATVKDAGRKILYTIGGSLSRVRNRIEIDGHTDNRPLEGAGQSAFGNNWELSLARAAQVASILENVGYQQTVTITGHAGARYQDLANIKDENRRAALSRRVDITIMNYSGKTEKMRAAPPIIEGRP